MTVRVHCRVYFPVAIAALGAAVMTAAPGCTSGPPPPVDERPYEERVVADRARKDAEFRAPDNKFSPVPQEKRAGFPALAYYPVRAEYRAPAVFQDAVSDTYGWNNNALRRFREQIKDAVDPNGIISAGRYGVWPKHLRDA